jgi:hypothetical protein
MLILFVILSLFGRPAEWWSPANAGQSPAIGDPDAYIQTADPDWFVQDNDVNRWW